MCRIYNNSFRNILYRRLMSYAEEIIGDCQSGFRSGSSTGDHTFTRRQLQNFLGKNLNYITYLLILSLPMIIFRDRERERANVISPGPQWSIECKGDY